MKIIRWDVQGAEKSQVVQEVKFLARIRRSDMVFFNSQNYEMKIA